MNKIFSLFLRSATPASLQKDKVPAPVALTPQQLGMVSGGKKAAPVGTW